MHDTEDRACDSSESRREPAKTDVRRRPFEAPLLLVGVRCTLRYVLLPLILPLLGTAATPTLDVVTGAALGVVLILDVISIMYIATTARSLWRRRRPGRVACLGIALVLVAVVSVLFVNDLRVLTS